MHGSSAAAKAEWRGYWYLPMLGCLGYSMAVLHIYIIGPFMAPLQQAFGWSRAELSFGLTIANFGAAFSTVLVGVMVDRFGPRRIALIGVPLLGAAVAALSTVTGSFVNWVVMWVIIFMASLFTQTTVWSSAVVGRFEASRGLALAIILSGGSLTAAVLPLLSTWLIGLVGWRMAFMAIGLGWAAILWPLLFFFFRSSQDGNAAARAQSRAAAMTLSGYSLSQALRRPAFYKLAFAGGAFTFGVVGVVVHFVPILVGNGASALMAASAASFIGLFAIVGRLGAGVFLDRFPGHYVGFLAFLLPVPGCLLLLFGGVSPVNLFIAAISFGLTLGAEIDLICYLATRHFGLRHFGTVLGALLAGTALGSAFGPLAAGATFDWLDSYFYFITLTAVLMVLGALAMLALGRGPRPEELPQA